VAALAVAEGREMVAEGQHHHHDVLGHRHRGDPADRRQVDVGTPDGLVVEVVDAGRVELHPPQPGCPVGVGQHAAGVEDLHLVPDLGRDLVGVGGGDLTDVERGGGPAQRVEPGIGETQRAQVANGRTSAGHPAPLPSGARQRERVDDDEHIKHKQPSRMARIARF
jgi:hypothetical protein